MNQMSKVLVGQLQIEAVAPPKNSVIYLYGSIIKSDIKECKIVNEITFRPLENLYETHEKQRMCCLELEAATELMSDLWDAGIRPLQLLNRGNRNGDRK